jgi:4-hydroxybenzoate polyprenyltransferase
MITALARACHPGPTLAVTTLTALLSHAAGHTVAGGALVTAALFTGQLSIGWSNDLIDARRDRSVGRTDKPVAGGDVSEELVRRAIGLSLAGCIALSLALGPQAAAVHLLLGVAMGWAYNLGLKATPASPAPYAVAFTALPAVVWLALPGDGWWSPRIWPPLWVMVAGGVLGVGLHLLNALPDLADDAATGVRGLPHVLGERRVRWLAPAVLLLGSVVTAFGPVVAPASASGWLTVGGLTVGGLTVVDATVLALCLVLAVVAARGRGRLPFLAAIGIAALDVLGLVLRS